MGISMGWFLGWALQRHVSLRPRRALTRTPWWSASSGCLLRASPRPCPTAQQGGMHNLHAQMTPDMQHCYFTVCPPSPMQW